MFSPLTKWGLSRGVGGWCVQQAGGAEIARRAGLGRVHIYFVFAAAPTAESRLKSIAQRYML